MTPNAVAERLLPCPFCGGEASFEAAGVRWTVGCSETDVPDPTNESFAVLCYGYQSLTTFATRREATVAWNRRAALEQAPVAPEQVAAAVERLDKVLTLPADIFNALRVLLKSHAAQTKRVGEIGADNLHHVKLIEELHVKLSAAEARVTELEGELAKQLRAKEPLKSIRRLMPKGREFSIQDTVDALADAGIECSKRQVFNAFTFLTRRGQIKHVGYGKYYFAAIKPPAEPSKRP